MEVGKVSINFVSVDNSVVEVNEIELLLYLCEDHICGALKRPGCLLEF